MSFSASTRHRAPLAAYLRHPLVAAFALCLWMLTLATVTVHAEGDDVTLAEPVDGLVTGTRLNVRARPGTRYEVVCQLVKGDTVKIMRRDGDWLGILAPTQVNGWVPLRTLNGTTITVDNTPVYAGPGAIYSSFDLLFRGDTVKIVRTQDNLWAMIAPPVDAIVWVHRDYIETNEPALSNADVVRPNLPELAATPVPEGVVAANPAPATGPRSPETLPVNSIPGLPVDRSAIAFVGTPRDFHKTATVIALDATHRPFQYALATEIDGTFYPLCYLSMDGTDLKEWLWKRVTIEGAKHWMRNWPRPLVKIGTIAAANPDSLGG